jgi:hypothetical protein
MSMNYDLVTKESGSSPELIRMKPSWFGELQADLIQSTIR